MAANRADRVPYTYSILGSFMTSVNEDFTTRTAARWCNELAERLGPGHVVVPEPIFEGGLLILEWPGSQPAHYKAVRFQEFFSKRTGQPSPGHWKWPWVESPLTAVVDSWHAQPPTTIGTAGTTRSFCFKAFDGAPVWTRAELKALKEAGEVLGLTVKLPTNRAIPTLTTYPMT